MPRGIGKTRGVDGFIIGPEIPIRGFKDILLLDKQFPSNRPNALDNETEAMVSPSSLRDAERGSGANHRFPYRLVHCGYSDTERGTATLKLKTDSSPWSKPFSLITPAPTQVVELNVPNKKSGSSGEKELSWSHWLNWSGKKRNSLRYCFGIQSTMAEPPFERTKVVVVVDRFVVINSVGQSVEVRQDGSENITTINSREEMPVYWRPGRQSLQVCHKLHSPEEILLVEAMVV